MKKFEDETKLTFTRGAQPLVLEALGYKDKNGLIVNSKTEEPVLDYEGNTVPTDRLGSISKNHNGDTVFMKDDIHSIIDMLKDYEQR